MIQEAISTFLDEERPALTLRQTSGLRLPTAEQAATAGNLDQSAPICGLTVSLGAPETFVEIQALRAQPFGPAYPAVSRFAWNITPKTDFDQAVLVVTFNVTNPDAAAQPNGPLPDGAITLAADEPPPELPERVWDFVSTFEGVVTTLVALFVGLAVVVRPIRRRLARVFGTEPSSGDTGLPPV